MENESEIGHNSHFFHFTAFRRNIQEAFKKIKEISQKFLKSFSKVPFHPETGVFCKKWKGSVNSS